MSDWIDGWAKRAARKDSADVAELGGINRRDMIKRAGVVGAAVWAMPVIQSVAAPAFAASNELCPQGATDPVDECGGPNCRQCGAGGRCSVASDCLSNYCDASGFCKRSVTGGGCSVGADCESNRCSGGICAPSNVGGACAGNGDCSSGKCQFGYCQQSKLGGQCGTTADCKQAPIPLVCRNGTHICAPVGGNGNLVGGLLSDVLEVVDGVVDTVTELLEG